MTTGQDSSIGMKDDPKLHYDPLDVSTHVGLQTPPRVLTLDDGIFPDTQEKSKFFFFKYTRTSRRLELLYPSFQAKDRKKVKTNSNIVEPLEG